MKKKKEENKKGLLKLELEHCETSLSVKIYACLCVPYNYEVSLPPNGIAKIALCLSSVYLLDRNCMLT